MKARSQYLRSATPADAELVYGWRNRPEIVSLGASGRRVSWDEHKAWFERVIGDPSCLLFLILKDEKAVGQLRFDRMEGALDGSPPFVVVTIYLLDGQSGKGLGHAALDEGCRIALGKWPDVYAFVAHVLWSNEIGSRFFIRNSFSELPPQEKSSVRVFRRIV